MPKGKGKKKKDQYAKCSSQLLNFHFEPHPGYIQQAHSGHISNSQTKFSRRSHKTEVYREKINSETYVAGRFKFCLSKDTAASGLIGKDKVLWNDIRRVIVQSDSEVSCPICISPVVAPRMTNCGHIFCWLCIRRMFLHSKEIWDKCPMCYSFIRLQDIKRVKPYVVPQDPVEGEYVDFDLVHRYSSCMVCKPVDANSSRSPLPCFEYLPQLPEELTPWKLYSRLYIENDRSLLKDLAIEEKAIIASLQEARTYDDHVGYSILRDMFEETTSQQESILLRSGDSSVHNQKEERARLENVMGEPITYLYQYEDKNVFLHPFTVHCLLQQFGEMSHFPVKLEKIMVLDLEHIIMTPESRKRYPFLGHLPPMATVTFVEADVSNYLDENTKTELQPEIVKREKKREVRKRTELRAQKKASLSVRKEWLQQVALFDSNLLRKNIDSGYEFLLPDSSQGNFDPSPISSFAAVVNQNGYFPALGEGTISKSASPPKSAWGALSQAMQRSPAIATSEAEIQRVSDQSTLNSPAATAMDSLPLTILSRDKEGKKGKGKKVSLFSNSQPRLYGK